MDNDELSAIGRNVDLNEVSAFKQSQKRFCLQEKILTIPHFYSKINVSSLIWL